MSFSDFTLDKVRKTFDLTISDKTDIFAEMLNADTKLYIVSYTKSHIMSA